MFDFGAKNIVTDQLCFHRSSLDGDVWMVELEELVTVACNLTDLDGLRSLAPGE